MKNCQVTSLKSTLVVSSLTCLLIVDIAAQDQSTTGITFIDNNWPQALEKAVKTGKNIFIDAYTTWCGPCKMMDEQVFADSSVAAFFGEHFINLKLDMEKGDGLDLAEQYQVNAYPSFLFIDSEKNLVHRGIGFHPVPTFIELGKEALDPSRQLGALARKYKRGDRSPALVYDYAMALIRANDEKGLEIGADYLQDQEEWASAKNLPMVFHLARNYGDPYYDFVVAKKHLFIRKFGEPIVNGRLLSILETHLLSQVEQLDLEQVKREFKETFTASKAEPFYDLFELRYYDITGDQENYTEASRAYIKKYPNLSWSVLNSIAWNFYEKIDDPKALKWAIRWVKKSIQQNSNHFNNDTLAALYYKIGKKKKALKLAEKAIELAKANGAPFDETADLLERIKAM